MNGILARFVRYTTMNVMGMIGLSCYILADTFFIAQGLGADGLTALNLAIPVYSFIQGAGLMVGMGGATRYSLMGGRQGGEGARTVFSRSLLLVWIAGTVLAAAGLLGGGKLALLFGADEATYAMTSIYLRVLLLFAPAFLSNHVLLCFVRNDGSPRLAMAAMLGGSFSNIILDYFFIFPLNLGMFGAVLATCMAPLISMAILGPHFFRRNAALRVEKVSIPWSAVKEISALGASSFVASVSEGAVMIVFNLVILGLEGNLGVAAYGVVANLSLVVTSVFTGLGQGIQPLVSGNVGGGRKDLARTVYRYALAVGLGIAVLVIGAACLWADPIVAVFNEAKNPALQAIAVRGMKLYFPAFLFVGINVVTAAWFSAAGLPGPAFLLSVLRGFVFILPVTMILSRMWAMDGVWLAVPMTEGLAALVGAGLMHRMRPA